MFLGNDGIYTTLGGAVTQVAKNGGLVDGKVASIYGTYGESLDRNVIGLRAATTTGGPIA